MIMHRKYSNFLIVLSIGVILLGVYSYFYNSKSEASLPDGSITSSLDTSSTGDSLSISDTKIAEDISFLTKLIMLKNIKIDSSLFQEQSFSKLIDNNVKLDTVPYGRTNPFSPIDKVSTNSQSVSSLRTNPATLISSKSAALNGSIEGASSSNVYFEYGPTETLGKTTSKVSPSMVGNFTTTITGLSPKTTYFFRITANVNGSLTHGDTMSFNTN